MQEETIRYIDRVREYRHEVGRDRYTRQGIERDLDLACIVCAEGDDLEVDLTRRDVRSSGMRVSPLRERL